jgi:hemoglobin
MTEKSDPEQTSDLERLGGEQALREIVEDFVDRVIADLMIGFHFRGVDKARLCQLEFEFARAHLGGKDSYSGRPLRNAHAPHRIMGGQFNRRLRILDKTLEDHAVPRDIRSSWIAHNESLRSQITADGPLECND